jgi:hypothetical protein
MRYLLFFIIFLHFSCASKKEVSLEQTVSGNWFILYPKDELTNSKQEKIYAAIQDSLTALKCLKLISFSEQGIFNQLDSIKIKGKWGTKDEMYVRVTDGGRGFDDFRTTFDGFDDGILKLTEIVNSGGEKLKFVWHLMKIDKGDPNKLFDPEFNKWRTKPARPESDEELKKRLVQMLDFYSIYFKLIADNSSYFIPGRIILPFKFYQHGIGMKFFDEQSAFASLFYSKEQAKKAHLFLDLTIGNVKFDTQNLKSYTEEYSLMLKKIAREVLK